MKTLDRVKLIGELAILGFAAAVIGAETLVWLLRKL